MSTSVEGLIEVRNNRGKWESLDIFIREDDSQSYDYPVTTAPKYYVEYTTENGEKKKVLATQTILYFYKRFVEHCTCYAFVPKDEKFLSLDNFINLCNSDEDVTYKEIGDINAYMKEYMALSDEEKDKRSYEDFIKSVKRDFIEIFDDDNNAKIITTSEKITIKTKRFDSMFLGCNFRDAIGDFSVPKPPFKDRGFPKDMDEKTLDCLLPFLERKGSWAWGRTYFTLAELFDYYNKKHDEWTKRVYSKIDEMRNTDIVKRLDSIMTKLEIKKPKKNKNGNDEYVPTMSELREDMDFLLEEELCEVESIYNTYIEMRAIASSAYNYWVSDDDIRLIIYYC